MGLDGIVGGFHGLASGSRWAVGGGGEGGWDVGMIIDCQHRNTIANI